MLSNKDKNKNKKLNSKNQVLDFLTTVETTVQLDSFIPFLVNKTEDQVIEFVKQLDVHAKKIAMTFQNTNETSGSSIQTIAKFDNWFAILVAKHLNKDDAFLFDISNRKPFELTIEIAGIEDTLRESNFSNNWLFPVEKDGIKVRSYLATKFKHADRIGVSLLAYNLKVNCTYTKNSENAIVTFELVEQSEKLDILKQLKSKNLSQLKKLNWTDLEKDPNTDKYKSITEMLIGEFKK